MKDIEYIVYKDSDIYSRFTSLTAYIGNHPGMDKYDEESIHVKRHIDDKGYKKFWII